MERTNEEIPRCVAFERYHDNIPNPTEQTFNLLRNLAHEYWKWFLQKLAQLKSLCFWPRCNIRPTLAGDPQLLERISQARGWKTAAIRYIEFHPTTSLMALLNNRDEVLIYDKRSECPIRLQSVKQRDTTCAAFRPWSHSSELAVGCAAGICLWQDTRRLNVELNIRNMTGTHHLQVQEDAGHQYVTSMQWNEDGTILITAALGSSHIVLWEPDSQQKIRLIPNPESSSSFSLLRYSPDFQVLFCASCDAGASLCQLNRSEWRSKQVLMQHRIQTAVWTPCGSFLLLVTDGSTRIYSCTNNGEATVFLFPKPLWRVELVMDLQEVTTCAGQQRYCGEPQTFAMDPLGIYMAIIFKAQSFVLLWLLDNSRPGAVRLLPLEFICCNVDGDQYPTCIAFGVSSAQTRLLVICWNTGHIQRYAITAKCFKEAQLIHNLK
ncbi:aladin isoform X1 [Drosophila santomea]|uniref:aladin isoform X1 n=1 Tax=Drosophila santomea TaxID=129105 RepID=UPI001953B887|nr:aladin isoform X1 [Drosophila santomea]